jgi:hypothetical protein
MFLKFNLKRAFKYVFSSVNLHFNLYDLKHTPASILAFLFILKNNKQNHVKIN